MPLTGNIRNQITNQIDDVFDAINAGTAFDNSEWIHQSFAFNAGGRDYIVQVLPEGYEQYASVICRIKRMP